MPHSQYLPLQTPPHTPLTSSGWYGTAPMNEISMSTRVVTLLDINGILSSVTGVVCVIVCGGQIGLQYRVLVAVWCAPMALKRRHTTQQFQCIQAIPVRETRPNGESFFQSNSFRPKNDSISGNIKFGRKNTWPDFFWTEKVFWPKILSADKFSSQKNSAEQYFGRTFC